MKSGTSESVMGQTRGSLIFTKPSFTAVHHLLHLMLILFIKNRKAQLLKVSCNKAKPDFIHLRSPLVFALKGNLSVKAASPVSWRKHVFLEQLIAKGKDFNSKQQEFKEICWTDTSVTHLPTTLISFNLLRISANVFGIDFTTYTFWFKLGPNRNPVYLIVGCRDKGCSEKLFFLSSLPLCHRQGEGGL